MGQPVSWQGAVNARDLGGLPTPGGPILPRRLIRSGHLAALTGGGRTELRESGVSRILDLRCAEERQSVAAPFLGEALYLNLPARPEAAWQQRGGHGATTSNFEYYRFMLACPQNTFALILQQIVDAPPGAVLLHCHVGKDRTGLAVALALFVLGASDTDIGADYVQTDQQLPPAAELLRQPDSVQSAVADKLLLSDPADMHATLAYLRELGGLAYLDRRGFGPAMQAALRERLTRPE